MKTETTILKEIAEKLASGKDHDEIPTEPDYHLKSEAKRLEAEIREALLAIDNFTRRDTFHFDTLIRLVDICDILFDIHHQIDPNVQILLNLLTGIKQIIPAEIRPNLRLPKAFVLLQKQPAEDFWDEMLPVLKAQGIDEHLIDIAHIPFKEFIEPRHKLFWVNYNWLKSYERKLEDTDWENADCHSKTEALISLLIASGMNDNRFVIYCKNEIEKRTTKKNGRREKLVELARCRKLILQDARSKSCPYKYKADPVVTQLLVWITAEEEYVNIHEPELPFAKLGFQLYQYTLAFLFKLLHEQKVFGDISFRELSKQVASTCTAMGADIPLSAMEKKAYTKKQVDFERMESLLLGMLEYVRRFL